MGRRVVFASLLALAAVGAGFAQQSEVAGKYVVVRYGSVRSGVAVQSWLELRSFPANGVRALTPRPVAGERRTECCGLFSPDGSKLAFRRKTPTKTRLLLLDLEAGTVRTLAQGRGSRDWHYVWARDSRSLLYSDNRVTPSRVYRVSIDGAATTISAFRTASGWTLPEGTSPDGSVALVVESRGPALYSEYEGPDVLYAVGNGEKVKLASTAGLGAAAWSPDGSLVAYAANCFSVCRIEVTPPDGGGRRRLTSFRDRTSPYPGFDELSFAWGGRTREIVYARGRTLYGIDAASGDQRRIRTLPCPRRRCIGPETTILALSQERDTAFVAVVDVSDGTRAPDYRMRLYRVSLVDGSYVSADTLQDAADIWFES